MSIQITRVGVTADLAVQVPRNAAGDLEAGARSLLAKVDGVEIEALDIQGLQPRLNDLTVEVRAELTVAVDGERPAADDVRDRLDDAFGISVERAAVD
jgi:hypothetical protein